MCYISNGSEFSFQQLKEREVTVTEENPLYGIVQKRLPKGKYLLHVVGFSFPDAVSLEQQQELMDECRFMMQKLQKEISGIKSHGVRQNIDPRKGYVWMEVAVFDSAAAFQAFHAHPEHAAFAKRVGANPETKWVVLDTAIEPTELVLA